MILDIDNLLCGFPDAFSFLRRCSKGLGNSSTGYFN